MDFDITSDINSGELDNSGVVPASQGNVTSTTTPAGTVNHGAQPAAAPVAAPDAGTAKEPSLRDRLSSAFKGTDAAPAEQAQAQVNTGQQRGPDGKFISPAAVDPNAVVTDPNAQQPQGIPQAPRGMSHEDYQKFNALPAEMQQFVARTMEGLETQAAKYQTFEGIDQLIAPRRQAWAMNGMTEQSALTQLFALSDFATHSPVDFVRWFAGSQGINLGALAQGGGQSQQVDPVIAQMQQQLEQLTGTIGQQTQAQQQQATERVVNSIVAFAEEKGTDGQPLRPYFQELGGAVKPYVEAVRDQYPNWTHTQILQEAYERACWATPTIRTRMQQAESAKLLADRTGQASRARAAAVSVNGAPSGGDGQAASSASGSLRDTLREQFAAARA